MAGGGRSRQPEDVGLAPKGLLSEAGPQARVTFFGGGCQATTEWGTCGAGRKGEREAHLSSREERSWKSESSGLRGGVVWGAEASPAGASGLRREAKAQRPTRLAGEVDF